LTTTIFLKILKLDNHAVASQSPPSAMHLHQASKKENMAPSNTMDTFKMETKSIHNDCIEFIKAQQYDQNVYARKNNKMDWQCQSIC